MFENIGFIGLGLMGGSIAKSIKKYKLASIITAYDIDKHSLHAAKNDGTIDIIATEVDSAFANCDLIFLCCPVKINVQLTKKLATLIKPQCLLTDIGSTKVDIHNAMAKNAPEVSFIGGHPMTGSEKSGYNVSNPLLFENIYYVLTRGPKTTDNQMHALTALVQNIDSIPIEMDPVVHDDATAAISHVPHIIAAAMVNTVEALDTNNGYMHTLAAGGFKDLTRIASSSPQMWEAICLANKAPIIKTLDHTSQLLKDFASIIQKSDGPAITESFVAARDYRNSFNEQNKGLIPNVFAFSIDVDDEPGIIARIATILFKANINIKNIGIINNRELDQGVLQIQFKEQQDMDQSIEMLTNLGYTVYK